MYAILGNGRRLAKSIIERARHYENGSKKWTLLYKQTMVAIQMQCNWRNRDSFFRGLMFRRA
jgi:hypothetical protein